MISPYEKKILAFNKLLQFNEEFTLNVDSLKQYETAFNFFVKLKKENISNLTIEIKLHEDDEPELLVNVYEMDKDSLAPDSNVINSTSFGVPDSNNTVNPDYIQ